MDSHHPDGKLSLSDAYFDKGHRRSASVGVSKPARETLPTA
jgi:hypothetical protein